MADRTTAGERLRQALAAELPLQVAGAINAYAALLAGQCGFRALYLSGAGVANAAHGLPDLGMTTLNDVAEEVRRITAVTDLPLLVDMDTGWGHGAVIGRAVRELERAGAAGVHIEDQGAAKRCGHRPGKSLVSAAEMTDRLKAALDGRVDGSFAVMARTDALAVEGLEEAVSRAVAYRDAGADMLFPEALTELCQYRRFAEETGLPVLANMTEFGVTPLFTTAELASAGVRLALYPLSAFRAMSAAALKVYRTIRLEGSQRRVVAEMQSRAELYETLRYHEYERRLDGRSGGEDGS